MTEYTNDDTDYEQKPIVGRLVRPRLKMWVEEVLECIPTGNGFGQYIATPNGRLFFRLGDTFCIYPEDHMIIVGELLKCTIEWYCGTTYCVLFEERLLLIKEEKLVFLE